MTKRHHPHNRAERLALKQELDETKKHAAKVRRKVIASLKEQETEDELREIKRGLDPS